MKIIAAPNAFKGSLSATMAAKAIRNGALRAADDIEVLCIPVTDGGDGLVDVLTESLGGQTGVVQVAGPRQTPVDAFYGYISDQQTAIIEMAQASGLVLVPEGQRNPMETTTLGTGQIMQTCIDRGARRLILGIGGSATCDGGMGAATALGYRFLDRAGNELSPVGKNLSRIHSIDRRDVDSRLFDVQIDVICDVTNPLTGRHGASHVYSPQKGANDEEVMRLDEGLQNLAEVIRREMGIDVERLPGGGAAGGMGAGMFAFFGGRLAGGIGLVLDMLGFATHLRGADLVITGEGHIDEQTGYDKAPAGVGRLAMEAGVHCVAVCGGMGEGVATLRAKGIDAVFSLCRGPRTLAQAMEEAEEALADTAEQIVRLFMAGRNRRATKC